MHISQKGIKTPVSFYFPVNEESKVMYLLAICPVIKWGAKAKYIRKTYQTLSVLYKLQTVIT